MKPPGPLPGLQRATDDALSYVARTFTTGLAPVLLIGLVLGEAGGVFLLVYLVSLAVVLPGSIVVNFAAQRRRRWRDHRRDPDRPRRAAYLTVVLFWICALPMAAIPVRPSELVVRFLGSTWAFALHVGTLMVVSSTLGQTVAWSQRPRKVQTLPSGGGTRT